MKLLIYLLFTFSFQVAIAQESFTYVFLNTNPDKEKISDEKAEELQNLHMQNIGKLAREGKLLVAGPFNSGGGIFILNTADKEKARSWILTDPAIRANRYRIEIFEWTPRVGSACLIDTSASMVEHTFVRYVPHITKYNVQKAPEFYLKHDKYLDKIIPSNNVISEGIFDNNDGGVIIFENEIDTEIIMADPTVVEGVFLPEIKTIWVGRGSFCETEKG